MSIKVGSISPSKQDDKKRNDPGGGRKTGEGDTSRRTPLEQDVDILFHTMSTISEGKPVVKLQKVIQEIKSTGIIFNRDPRIRQFEQAALKVTGDVCLRDYELTKEEFVMLMESNMPFLVNVLMKRLIIDNFDSFSQEVDKLYYNQVANTGGKLSDEIPELLKVNKSLWGVAVCSIDGQRKLAGDTTVTFSMQNLCKPFIYGLALSLLKRETIDEYISHEPANVVHEVLEINDDKKPFNPMVDTGALMLSCLLSSIAFKDKSPSYMQETYNEFLKSAIQNDYMDFRATAYQAKKESADLLRCISHGIASECKIPPICNVLTSLDLYLKACSIEVNAEGLSVLAATFANGGINPFTEKQVIERAHMKQILCSMYTFGLYEFSGENGFIVGMPMKCSSSGGLIMVVPGKMGIGLYSPLINEYNIGVKAYSFCVELAKCFNLHPFDLSNNRGSTNFILRRQITRECVPYCELFNTAAKGDLRQLMLLEDKKVDFFQTDDFGHNVLHVAAAAGFPEVIKYLLDRYTTLAANTDKWNRLPRDYVDHVKQFEAARLFDRPGKNSSQ